MYWILVLAIAVWLIPREMIRRLTGRDSEDDRLYRAFEQRLASKAGRDAGQAGLEEIGVVDERE